jgi:hypothetical protein
MVLSSSGPGAGDRAASLTLAVALHALVFAVAAILAEPVPHATVRAAPEPKFEVRLWRVPFSAAAAASAPGRRRAGVPKAWGERPPQRAEVPGELRVSEREIIDQGSGVTMTIEGGADPDVRGDSARRGPPLDNDRRWLRMQVWVGSTLTAPRPSAWCVPRVPQMPEEAIEGGITGRVEVTYEVDAQGVVGAIGMEGSPPPLLAGAVHSWLSGCLFEPAIQDGRRAAARVRQAFVFKIR